MYNKQYITRLSCPCLYRRVSWGLWALNATRKSTDCSLWLSPSRLVMSGPIPATTSPPFLNRSHPAALDRTLLVIEFILYNLYKVSYTKKLRRKKKSSPLSRATREHVANCTREVRNTCKEKCVIGCPRFAYLLDYLSVSLRLYFLEGTGRRRCFLPSASKSQI